MDKQTAIDKVVEIVQKEADLMEGDPITVTPESKPSEITDSLGLIDVAMKIESSLDNDMVFSIPMDFLKELNIEQLVNACLGELLPHGWEINHPKWKALVLIDGKFDTVELEQIPLGYRTSTIVVNDTLYPLVAAYPIK